MKKLIVLLMILAFAAATVAVAADSVTYESKQGNVVFTHKDHGKAKGITCKDCHGDKAPAKIEVTKDVAHKAVCKDCHAAKGGPTKCGDCHKK